METVTFPLELLKRPQDITAYFAKAPTNKLTIPGFVLIRWRSLDVIQTSSLNIPWTTSIQVALRYIHKGPSTGDHSSIPESTIGSSAYNATVSSISCCILVARAFWI